MDYCICICQPGFKTISATSIPHTVFPSEIQDKTHHSDNRYIHGQYRSRNVFQVDTEIGRKTRISLRVLFKLLFAPVAAEVIFLVFVHTGELSIFFINYHQTDGIGTHDSSLILLIIGICF